MAKSQTSFFCRNCGSQSSQWMGQCKNCNEWNTIQEEIIFKNENKSNLNKSFENEIFNIQDIPPDREVRFSSFDKELDRVLGGGIVLGSVILLGGEPGIGKSTLLLQLALKSNNKVLYISGEESASQIKIRAERTNLSNENCFVWTETNVQKIIQQTKKFQPQLIIIDSIQTIQTSYLESSAGTISQIRESTADLIKLAKETNIPIFLIGHITKDGNIAGPKILEHMVDVVLQFEGDRNFMFRLIRSHKNRFGSTAEIGIYEMQSNGLREVSNPSALLISSKEKSLSGNAIAVNLEGIRPMLIEIQALVSTAVYGTPQRSTTGFDPKRLNMLLAVLEKRAGFHLGVKDVFLNITGGMRVDDPAIDLAVISAVLSSNLDIALPDNVCYTAEVGLSGEIRAVPRIEQRILEAEKLGYDAIFISKYNKLENKNYSINIQTVGKIEDFVRMIF